MTESEYVEASEDNLGYCKNCKEITGDCCEPDARNYTCPECGLPQVFGMEEALLMGLISFDEDE